MLRQTRTAEVVGAVVQTAVRWSAGALIAFWAYRSVAVLAGRATLADLGLRFLADVSISKALAWVLVVLSGGYGLGERKLRKDTIERLQGRIRQLETIIDPKRTSSQLTPRGDTRPEDRL